MLRTTAARVGFVFLVVTAQPHASKAQNTNCHGVLTKSDKARWLEMGDDQLRLKCFSRTDVKAPNLTSLTQNGYSVGLHFHENISQAQRKQIINDLLWLSRRGDEIHTELLADILGIEGPTTGPKILAWLLDRVAVISNAPLRTQPVVITPFVVDGRYLAFQARPYAASRGSVWPFQAQKDGGDFAAGVPNVKAVGDTNRGEIRSFRFGAALTLPILRGAKMEHQSFLLGRALWANSGSEMEAHMIFRLLAYLHEGAHLGFADGHLKCSNKLPDRNLRGKYACDKGFLTANGLSYAFADSMSRLKDLRKETRAWFAKYAKALLTRVNSHEHAALPRQPIPTDEALNWLRAATAASNNGYNVPLRHVVPCEKFAGGCGRQDLEAAILRMRKWPNEYGQWARISSISQCRLKSGVTAFSPWRSAVCEGLF